MTDFEDYRDRDGFDADIEAAYEEELEAMRDTDRIAAAVAGLPETRFAFVPDSILPIFEFDEAQRAFQRMMYYSRFQEV